jgi:hypothetical protein
MDRHVRNERGIALAIAIFALVVVGALVAAAFFAGSQEQRLAENAKRVTQSFGIAEAGVAERVRLWDPVLYNQQRVYPLDSAVVAQTRAPARTGSYGGYVYKLNDNLFLTDIRGSDSASRTGRVRGSGARQRLGLLTRIRPWRSTSGLTTQGDVRCQNAKWATTTSHPGNCDHGRRWMSATIKATPRPREGGSRQRIRPVTGRWRVFSALTQAVRPPLPPGSTYHRPSLAGEPVIADDLNWGDGPDQPRAAIPSAVALIPTACGGGILSG